MDLARTVLEQFSNHAPPDYTKIVKLINRNVWCVFWSAFR
jgi:hypothetical protein